MGHPDEELYRPRRGEHPASAEGVQGADGGSTSDDSLGDTAGETTSAGTPTDHDRPEPAQRHGHRADDVGLDLRGYLPELTPAHAAPDATGDTAAADAGRTAETAPRRPGHRRRALVGLACAAAVAAGAWGGYALGQDHRPEAAGPPAQGADQGADQGSDQDPDRGQNHDRPGQEPLPSPADPNDTTPPEPTEPARPTIPILANPTVTGYLFHAGSDLSTQGQPGQIQLVTGTAIDPQEGAERLVDHLGVEARITGDDRNAVFFVDGITGEIDVQADGMVRLTFQNEAHSCVSFDPGAATSECPEAISPEESLPWAQEFTEALLARSSADLAFASTTDHGWTTVRVIDPDGGGTLDLQITVFPGGVSGAHGTLPTSTDPVEEVGLISPAQAAQRFTDARFASLISVTEGYGGLRGEAAADTADGAADIALPAPKQVTLQEPVLSSTQLTVQDRVYLVPSYTFTGEDGTLFSVPALPDNMLGVPPGGAEGR